MCGTKRAAGPATSNLACSFLLRDAGGSRTHFNRFAAGGLAVWLQRHQVARPGIEPGLRPSQSRVQSATLTGCKYRVRESNPVPQFRRLRCYPAHPHGMFSISTWNRTRTWTLGESCAIRPLSNKYWPSRYGADDWTCTSINRFTKSVPSYSATSAKHERKESNPVRQFWRLTALPGAHSCKGYPTGVEPVLPASQAGVRTMYATDAIFQ